jgi:exodeoxyribonuclease V alpha subunit
VLGIGLRRARQIIEGWAEQRAVRKIMIFLQEHQITTARSVRIYRLCGSDAIRLIKSGAAKVL